MFKILFCFLFSLNLWAQQKPVYTPVAKGLNPKSYRIDIMASYFPTSAVYNVNGEKTSLEGNNSYTMLQGDLTLGYGIGKKLDVYFNARGRQVDSTYSLGNTELSVSNSGLESFAGWFKYAFEPNGNIQWAVDFLYRQTTYEQKFYQSVSDIPENDLVLGDAGQEYSFGVHVSFKRSSGNYLDGTLRYVVPGNDLSDELNYRAQSAWLWKRFGFILGVQGISSFKKDNFTTDPENKPFQATGASGRFNSINREKVEPFLGINYAFRTWRAEFETGITMSGRSTDEGQYFRLGMVYVTPGLTGDSFKISSFKEYIIDATVLKVSPRGRFVKIDQGVSSDVEKGMKFDIFQTDYFGENILVGSGLAYEVNADSSIIKVVKKYKKISIKKGFSARGY